MRGGAMRNLLTVQRQMQMGVDAYNAPNMVWQDWRPDIFCEVDVKRGREHFENGQRYSEEVWRFRVRFDEIHGLDTSMRILHEGMLFDIKASLPDGQMREDIIIECTVQDSVMRAAALVISITTMIHDGVVSQVYEPFVINPNGGAYPYVVSIDSGVLPVGLMMNPATGEVSGTPTAAGEYTFVAKVTDALGETSTLPPITLTITA